MAIYDRREYTTRTYEWAVPNGCGAGELDQACSAGHVTYRQVHGLPADAPPADDWLRVFAMDDEIVVRFEVREPEVTR